MSLYKLGLVMHEKTSFHNVIFKVFRILLNITLSLTYTYMLFKHELYNQFEVTVP